MGLNTVKPSPGFLEHLPVEYQDLVKHGQYGKKKKVTDMGKFKELVEEHPMCAGCAMTLYIRLVFLGLPKPEHTIFVPTLTQTVNMNLDTKMFLNPESQQN